MMNCVVTGAFMTISSMSSGRSPIPPTLYSHTPKDGCLYTIPELEPHKAIDTRVNLRDTG